MCVNYIVIEYNNILICNYIYNSCKIVNIIYIYNVFTINKYIYVITCICNNNINDTILYNKKKKNEKHIYLYFIIWYVYN